MRVDEAMQLIADAMVSQVSPEALTAAVRTTLLNVVSGNDATPSVTPSVATELVPFLAKMDGSFGALPRLYEEALQWEVAVDGGVAAVVPSGGKRRKSGRYYTPDVITRYMASRARYHAPGAQTAIDPACGAGAFLVALHQEFGEKGLRLTGLDSDPLALTLCRTLLPEVDLYETDALLGETRADFDICLANPPYVTGGLRGMRGHKDADWKKLCSQLWLTAQYKFSTYPLFVERGLQLVREGGVAGYILPDSFLTGKYFEGLRRLLALNTILEVTLIRSDFWSHGRVGQSVIIIVRKAAPPPNHRALIRVIDDPSSLHISDFTPVPIGALTWGRHGRFRLAAHDADRAFIRQVEAASPIRMGGLIKTYSGLIGRNGQRSLLLSENPDWQGQTAPLLRSGSEVDRYSIQWSGERVCLEPTLIKSGGNLNYYRQPKLLMRQTADSLRAAYDDTGFYCLNNLHLISSRSSPEVLLPILALINSETLNRYYGLSAMELGRLYAQVDLDLFEDLPVPELSDRHRRHLADLAVRISKAAPEVRAALRAEIEDAVVRAYGLG